MDYKSKSKIVFKDYAGAIEDYNKAIALDNGFDDVMIYNNCIAAYELLGDYEGARNMEERGYCRF